MWNPDGAVSTSEDVLLSAYRPAYVPGKIVKGVFTAVEVLWGSCKPVYVRKLPDKDVLTIAKCSVKRVQASWGAREDQESSFHNCGGPVRLVEASLCAGETWSRRFIHREGAVKHV